MAGENGDNSTIAGQTSNLHIDICRKREQSLINNTIEGLEEGGGGRGGGRGERERRGRGIVCDLIVPWLTSVACQPPQCSDDPTDVTIRELVIRGVGHQQAQRPHDLRQRGGVGLGRERQQEPAVELPDHAPHSGRVRDE